MALLQGPRGGRFLMSEMPLYSVTLREGAFVPATQGCAKRPQSSAEVCNFRLNLEASTLEALRTAERSISYRGISLIRNRHPP